MTDDTQFLADQKTDSAALATESGPDRGVDFDHELTALGEADDRFRAFMDNSPTIVFMKDQAGRFVYLNAEWLRRFAQPGQSPLGKTAPDIFPGEVAVKLTQHDRAVLESGKATSFIENVLDANGWPTHWLVHKFPFRDHRGVQYLAGQGIDITERLEAEQSVRESRQRLKSALSASGTGTYFWNIQDETFDGDEEIHRLFGIDPDRPTRPPDWLSQIHPDDREKVIAAAGMCLKTHGAFDMDYRVVLPDGRIRWLHSRAETYVDAAGKPKSLSGACVDITQRKLSEQALSESENFANSIVDALTAQLAILDPSGEIIAVNRAWREFATGNGAEAAAVGVGYNYLDICAGVEGAEAEQAQAVARGIRGVIAGDQPVFTMEYRCDSPTEKRWFVLRVSRFPGQGPVRVVVAHEDVSERRLAQERLRHDSMHDSLTGLPNRVLLADRIERCIEHVRRHADRHFALMFLDLDRFKIINDSLGHVVGDKLLVTAATRISECVRSADTVARDEVCSIGRFGGDEFVILLEELRSPEDAARAAERILASLAQPMNIDGQEIITTASIGIAAISSDNISTAMTAKDLIRDADMAMYCAKSKGRNQYSMFDTRLHESAMNRLRVESDLRHALERGELRLYFQPIISLPGRELTGFEALIRWNREGKLISPNDFIPIAEDTGLIVPIGQWVLRESCRQLAAWHKSFPRLSALYMSVNVSRRQLNDPQIIATVAGVLKESQLDARNIRLEITESVIMENNGAAKVILSQLKDLGVLISMDDFGTGYSSLSCLHEFPIDVMKIDRSFLADMGGKADSAAVIGAMVTLAHQLQLTVVAEGVETVEQLAFLQKLHCDSAQGYHFSKPMPVDAAEEFIQACLKEAKAA